MSVIVRLNHAIADGYLAAKVFRLPEQEIKSYVSSLDKVKHLKR